MYRATAFTRLVGCISIGAAFSVQARIGQAQAPTAQTAKTAPLVSAERIAALPTSAVTAAERKAWLAYVAASRADRLRDSTQLSNELRTLGQAKWTQPAVAADFRLSPSWGDRWFASDSAARIAATILSFQTPGGGWSKHVDMFGAPRAPGQSFFSETAAWDYIATLDNGATTTQLAFLARAYAVGHRAEWRDAFVRGVRYVLRAQLPSGGWPQVYPLQGEYHDATTYKNGATVHALRLLQDVASGTYACADDALKADAKAALARGVAGVLHDQTHVTGALTVWGQQHDPFTHEPVAARSYELAGLAGAESADLLDFLMSLDTPSSRVIESVHAGARWLDAHRIEGFRYDSLAGTLTPDAHASALWARVYEVPSFLPLMANRDGVPQHDFGALTDRRTGYAWYVDTPAAVLAKYPAWARLHPMGH